MPNEMQMHALMSLAIVAVSTLAISGIWGSPFMRFAAEQNAGQTVFHAQGAPVVFADGDTVRVMIGPANPVPKRNQRINFFLRVKNFSDQPVTISAEQIQAVRADDQEIRIWKAIDIRRAIASRADASQYAARMAGALDGFATGGATQDRDIARPTLELREKINRANNREALEIAMSDLFLERETIFPGQSFSCFVQIDPPDRKGKKTVVKFLTNFAGDPVALEFQYSRAK